MVIFDLNDNCPDRHTILLLYLVIIFLLLVVKKQHMQNVVYHYFCFSVIHIEPKNKNSISYEVVAVLDPLSAGLLHF